MNSYSHELYHSNQAREQQAYAERYRLGYLIKKNHRPAYKGLIAHVGEAFVRIGTILQDFSKFELDTEYTKTTKES